ncbi:hypothetical protein XH99_17595 [Bradyrhizobium nanningense]|uniref:Uncharacterized protein n=1 Tax=Bradyrhizobium nanningense TaxID=1325118 RepID=A0A4Q0S4B9_9BRAD|nr:hypothetical protein [Bradyrhizobium nanningense]RXH22503.1 hypothetical protein XH84_34975 [Bradyrhizobium nanningense]RXH26937.1 hypothetical protein XH99_17595 [Bradyrhizobium nanningense]
MMSYRAMRKRSIFNGGQFGVDGRKALFLVLLLFAIPAHDCSAQTPPPPDREHAFEHVPPTVVKRLVTRFSLGAFAGRFEKTRLGAVREAVGKGTIQHQGDAGDSVYWLCYRRAQHRLWIVSSGEMGGPDHLVTEVVEERTENDTETSTDCAIIPEKFAPLVFDGKLHLGMSRSEVVTALGPPSKSEAAQMVLTTESSQTVLMRPHGSFSDFVRTGSCPCVAARPRRIEVAALLNLALKETLSHRLIRGARNHVHTRRRIRLWHESPAVVMSHA